MAKPGPLAALVEIVCAMLLFIAAAAADSDVPITIRAYNTFGVSGAAFTSARAVAHRVLQLAGIQALWRECRTPAYQAPGDRCDDVLARNEIIVRVVRGPRFLGSTAPLGDSLIRTPKAPAYSRPSSQIACSLPDRGQAPTRLSCSGAPLRTKSAICSSAPGIPLGASCARNGRTTNYGAIAIGIGCSRPVRPSA